MSVDPTLRMLLSRTFRIERATVSGLTFTLPEQPKPDEPDEPLWIEPPLDVVVRDFALTDARVFDGREQLVHVRQLGVAARWSRDVLIIERLELLPGDIAGDLAASGRITPEGDTVRAVLKARWRDVVIPEKLPAVNWPARASWISTAHRSVMPHAAVRFRAAGGPGEDRAGDERHRQGRPHRNAGDHAASRQAECGRRRGVRSARGLESPRAGR